MIYAYEDASYPGCLKVGYTAVDVEKRVAQQYPTLRPEGKKPYRVIFAEPALYEDGSSFTDHAVHRMLEKKGVEGVGGEWFRCTEKEIRSAWLAVRTRTANMENRTRDFTMRPEQAEAVERTLNYFKAERADGRTPRFLWNAKMRFGKTFAAYQLARRLNARRALILTFSRRCRRRGRKTWKRTWTLKAGNSSAGNKGRTPSPLTSNTGRRTPDSLLCASAPFRTFWGE